MASTLRVLHSPSSSANPSQHPVVQVAIGADKYLFNAAEGVTRTVLHRHVNIGSNDHLDVFVPHSCTGARGLSGLLMTLADMGKSQINLYGPPCLAHSVASMRFFCRRHDSTLHIKESHTIGGPQNRNVTPAHDAGVLLDRGDGLVVRALPSWPQDWVQAPQLSGTSTAVQPSRKRRRSSSESSEQSSFVAPPTFNAEHDAAEFATNETTPTSLAEDLSSSYLQPSARSARNHAFAVAAKLFTTGRGAGNDYRRLPGPWVEPHVDPEQSPIAEQPVSLSFVMRLPDLPGKVDVESAKAVGIAPGPELAILQRGESVTIERPVNWGAMSEDEKSQWFRHLRATRGPQKKNKGKTSGEPKPEASYQTERVLIESSACVSSSIPGSLVIMTNLPSRSHLPSFLSSSNAQIISDAAQGGSTPTAIVHSSSPDVVRDDRYQAWVKSISAPDTHHIYTSTGTGPNHLLYPASLLPLLRMSTLDPDIFKVPSYNLNPATDVMKFHSGPDSAHATVSGLHYDLQMRLQPRKAPPTKSTDAADFDFDINASSGPDYEKRVALTSYSRREEDVDPGQQTLRQQLRQARVQAFGEFVQVSERVKAEVEALVKDGKGMEKDEWKDIKVTTLGTGSAQPSRYRNVSATLIELPERFRKGSSANQTGPFYILLDAGDGTLGQLAQHFGSQEALDQMLRNLRVFFVSHIHADHCSGASNILRARAELQPKATEHLFLVCPFMIRTFIEEWNDLEDLRIHPWGAEQAPDDGAVLLLDSEQLDYKMGIKPQPEHGDTASATESYFAHLRDGYNAGFQRSAAAVRKGLLCRPPFNTMTETELDAEADEIDRQVRQAVSWPDPKSAEGQKAQSNYEGTKQRERENTRRSLSLLESELGGDFMINTTEVDHRARHCYGVVVRLTDTSNKPFSLSYSGDTRPTPHLEEAAKGVDLFIHEATIQDDQPEMASKKGHSTVGGAIASGQKAQAKVTLLTHFSQRYPQMARLGNSGGSVNGSSPSDGSTSTPILTVGMDMLQLNMNDMWKMNKYLPAMEILFKADSVGAPEEEVAGSGTD